MSKKHSYHMFDQTERPGNAFPLSTHKIITHRYQFVANLLDGRRTLEIGCGAGMGLSYINARAATLIAGEYSEENIALTNLHNGNICPIVRMDGHGLPFKKKCFDAIIAMAMIYYLKLEPFLHEAKQVLDEDGILFFDTSNKDMPGFWPSPYVTRYYSIPELNEILRSNGFDPQFYGAFPATGSQTKRRIKAFIKDTVKRAVLLLPSGERLWNKIRYQAQEDAIPLPQKIGTLDCSDILTTRLDPNKKDYDHAVIYVVAKIVKDTSTR